MSDRRTPPGEEPLEVRDSGESLEDALAEEERSAILAAEEKLRSVERDLADLKDRHLRKLALARYEGYPPGAQTGLQRALAPLGKALLDWQGDSMTRLPWVGEGRLLDYGCGSGILAIAAVTRWPLSLHMLPV